MCGIVGILIGPDGAKPRRLATIGAMCAALEHRGPDGSGLWVDREAGVALAHRRLAIVDVSDAGHQPMVSHDGMLVTTYNGEIYNSSDLRAGLAAAGHDFRGHSDTEVMLGAFETYGIEATLPQCAGMFALGLWNRRTRVLTLVRDRMGKKPLYMALVDGALVFASELKALHAFPGFCPALNEAALAMVVKHGWVPDSLCVWEGVYKLPAGTMLSVGADELATLDGAALRARCRPWWSLAGIARDGQRDLFRGSPSEMVDALDEILRTAVRERMVADVPLGAFLSGGIDSALVVSLMQAQAAQPVRTFTIGFDEAGYDEAAHARRLARHIGTDHTEYRVGAAEARGVIPDLPQIWDEPFADESQIPTYLVSRLARQHVVVALSGDGGDECFGGYARHLVSSRFDAVFRLPLPVRRAAASALLLLGNATLERLLRHIPFAPDMRAALNGRDVQRAANVLGATDEHELYDRFTALAPQPLTLTPIAGHRYSGPDLPDSTARMLYDDMANYLPGDILVKLDRASMAVSLEARCPFLDHRVVEFAWRLPTSLKLRNGKGKWLPRQLLRRYVPEQLFERPKHGFNVPIGDWLRGPLQAWASDLLAAPRLRRGGFLDPVRTQACWADHLSGRRDRSGELWAVLMIESWLSSAQGPGASTYRNDDVDIDAAPVLVTHLPDRRSHA